MKKIFEFPEITPETSKSSLHVCDLCGACSICEKGASHKVGFEAYTGHTFTD